MVKQKYVWVVTVTNYDYDLFDDHCLIDSVEIVKVFTTAQKAYEYRNKSKERNNIEIIKVEVE